MMKNWIYIGTFALMCAYTLPIDAQNIILHNAEGKEIQVPTRKALPTDASRARYPGFKQETIVLKAGSIRREGAKPLTCDILLERDVPIKLRDGVTTYSVRQQVMPVRPYWLGVRMERKSEARCSTMCQCVRV